jgi:hypothetical protein
MSRFPEETPFRSPSLSKPGHGERARYFVPARDGQDVDRAEAADRPVRSTGAARHTWVLEHDTLVEHYLH